MQYRDFKRLQQLLIKPGAVALCTQSYGHFSRFPVFSSTVPKSLFLYMQILRVIKSLNNLTYIKFSDVMYNARYGCSANYKLQVTNIFLALQETY
jgi:hypothetical protein